MMSSMRLLPIMLCTHNSCEISPREKSERVINGHTEAAGHGRSSPTSVMF